MQGNGAAGRAGSVVGRNLPHQYRGKIVTGPASVWSGLCGRYGKAQGGSAGRPAGTEEAEGCSAAGTGRAWPCRRLQTCCRGRWWGSQCGEASGAEAEAAAARQGCTRSSPSPASGFGGAVASPHIERNEAAGQGGAAARRRSDSGGGGGAAAGRSSGGGAALGAAGGRRGGRGRHRRAGRERAGRGRGRARLPQPGEGAAAVVARHHAPVRALPRQRAAGPSFALVLHAAGLLLSSRGTTHRCRPFRASAQRAPLFPQSCALLRPSRVCAPLSRACD